jgi:hypothetical protein
VETGQTYQLILSVVAVKSDFLGLIQLYAFLEAQRFQEGFGQEWLKPKIATCHNPS